MSFSRRESGGQDDEVRLEVLGELGDELTERLRLVAASTRSTTRVFACTLLLPVDPMEPAEPQVGRQQRLQVRVEPLGVRDGERALPIISR